MLRLCALRVDGLLNTKKPECKHRIFSRGQNFLLKRNEFSLNKKRPRGLNLFARSIMKDAKKSLRQKTGNTIMPGA